MGRTQEFVIGVGLVGLWAFFLRCSAMWHTVKQKQKKRWKNCRSAAPLSPPLPWHLRQSGKFQLCQHSVKCQVQANHKPDLIVTSPEKFEPCCGTWNQPQASANGTNIRSPNITKQLTDQWLQYAPITKLSCSSLSLDEPPKNSVPFSILQRNIEHVGP